MLNLFDLTEVPGALMDQRDFHIETVKATWAGGVVREWFWIRVPHESVQRPKPAVIERKAIYAERYNQLACLLTQQTKFMDLRASFRLLPQYQSHPCLQLI